MELPTTDYSAAYMEVCKKANLPYNKLPKKGDDIPLAYEIAMKELNPHLYQNITSPDPDNLPVDVAKRYKQGLMWTSELQAYEENGFTNFWHVADLLWNVLIHVVNRYLFLFILYYFIWYVFNITSFFLFIRLNVML